MTSAPTAVPRTTRATTPDLGEAFRRYLGYPTPWIIGGALLVSLAARVAVGGWTWWDTALVVVLLVTQPLSEWVIHTTMLHWRPRRIGRFTVDWVAARDHRRHHADPRHIPLVFIPLPTLVKSLLAGALWFLLLPVPLALTAMLTVHAILTGYEWTHYLIHTDYRPRRALYRAIWRNHRLHHYRNERYWFGVMSPGGDLVFRTAPDPADVPVSPTATDLARAVGAA